MTEWKPDVCVYHGGCDDGFGAAWIVRKRYGVAVQFVPGNYGGTIQWPELAGKNVLFVDFSLKRDQMIQLANGGNTGAVPASIVVLDHHKTAEAELKQWDIGPVQEFSGNRIADHISQAVMEQSFQIVAHFDMSHSGARMAWDFCFSGIPAPALIEYVEDRDLWRFKYPVTREVSAALRTYPQDFETWDALDLRDIGEIINEGAIILRGHRKNISDFLRNRYWAEIGGVSVPVVNVPYHYASDCADEMLKAEPTAPFCASWFRRGDGRIQYSLRSRDDRMDVSEIARKLGGGGHRNAAGFEMAAQ